MRYITVAPPPPENIQVSCYTEGFEFGVFPYTIMGASINAPLSIHVVSPDPLTPPFNIDVTPSGGANANGGGGYSNTFTITSQFTALPAGTLFQIGVTDTSSGAVGSSGYFTVGLQLINITSAPEANPNTYYAFQATGLTPSGPVACTVSYVVNNATTTIDATPTPNTASTQGQVSGTIPITSAFPISPDISLTVEDSTTGNSASILFTVTDAPLSPPAPTGSGPGQTSIIIAAAGLAVAGTGAYLYYNRKRRR